MYDIIIIGAGPAGLTSAIYGRRANKKVLVLEANTYGGQIINTLDIENYPVEAHISGYDFATKLYNQVKDLGVEIIFEKAVGINDGKIKEVVTEKNTYKCNAVIVAPGSFNRKLGLDLEDELIGKGISYCATCDGMFYKGKDVAIVGGGNTAFESVLYLSEICNKVYLIHRRDEFRGENMYLDKIKSKKNIEILTNVKINELLELDNKLSGIILDNDKKIDCDALFVNIGNVPMPIKCEGLKTDDGYIIVDSSMKTNVDKIYACGDIIKKSVYQISTAAGEGTTAAISIIKDID